MIVREGRVIAVVGAIVGSAAAAFLGTSWSAAMLFGVSATDPLT
jgi:hypothetical protein